MKLKLIKQHGNLEFIVTDNQNILIDLIHNLVDIAQDLTLVKARDRVYYINRLYTLCNITPTTQQVKAHKDIERKLSYIVSQIYDVLSSDTQNQLGYTREQAETRIIDIILPAPSIVECIFNTIKTNKSIKDALDWYYQFSQHTDYIKVDAIAKNQKWTSKTNYGELEITINLSKPEKDPKEIAKARLVANSNYPRCLLCIENEGHQGNGNNQPARHNHRMIKIPLSSKEYYFQYSPYLYYPEHSIIINPEHKDMVINCETLENFFAFTNHMPHYIIGSNTDIPIAGGSILTHDHYQAGNYTFPIEKATAKFTFQLDKFQYVKIDYLNWPISTLKLTGSKHDLLELSLLILDKWYQYDNLALDILSNSNGQRHNAITPIMRKIGDDKYVLYLLLRNNRVSDEYPDGIFHPHSELHHIKKENIGLIEAMGLAILPGRLAHELEMIKDILISGQKFNQTDLSPDLIKHYDWIIQLQQKYSAISSDEINNIIKDEVANRFAIVLEHSGVFKQNNSGDTGINDFIKNIN